MQKLMMQCHIKDNRLHVPEYIIPMHLCKVESRFVKKTESLYLSVYLHNLTTNIKTVNIKSLINIANYGNDDPQCMSWQVLCQCLSSYSHASTFGELKKVFFQLHSDTSLKNLKFKAHVHPNGFARLCFCFETILFSNAVF